METLEKRPPANTKEQEQDLGMELVYKMVYKSAKEQGLIGDEVTIAKFRKMTLRDVMDKLKAKGIDRFEIML